MLTSTTGTWKDATSFAYQWSSNKAWIAGATAATYTPVSSDAGHTLTSTVVATGSPGALSSATSAATVPIVAADTGSPSVTVGGSVPFVALHTYYMSPTGSDSNNGLTAATPWATPNHGVNCGDVIIAAAGSYPDMQQLGNRWQLPIDFGRYRRAGRRLLRHSALRRLFRWRMLYYHKDQHNRQYRCLASRKQQLGC